MPTQQTRQTLGQVRTFIVGEFEGIGRSDWSTRFGESFTNGNIAATIAEIETLRDETWAAYVVEWDSWWQAAQDDVWSGVTAAGLTEARLVGVLDDSDVRASTVIRAMLMTASLLLMRHRHETR